MKSPVASTSLADVLDRHTAVGSLWHHEDGRIRCVACGHRCLIGEGKRGICKVRYEEAGQLRVPFGYVAGLQCDPVEKKPFFHVYPGSDALTFGMMGCDLHCSYCFPGETVVITNRGPMALATAFESAPRTTRTSDAEIAFPDGLQAVTSSGNCRAVRGIFKHAYRGPLVVLQPYHLPSLRCTPDHRVYATRDRAIAPQPIKAGELTGDHFLVVSKCHATRVVASCKVFETDAFYLVPLRQITTEAYDDDVYNMEVEEEHNYLAGFFLVKNCQNWVTSQALRDSAATAPIREVTPEQLVAAARREGARLVVSSYNEPLITAEWAVAVFRQARQAGLACAFVSNGNATPEVLDFLRPWIIAYKVDLKSFDDRHYRSLGGTLGNITDSIRLIHERGIWLEVVTLVIPGFNDSDSELRDMARFLAGIDRNIPWHVTAFHQDYRMTDPEATPPRTLLRAAEIGSEEGLRFVYAGNLPGRVGEWENTRCPSCQETLIERHGYLIRSYRIGVGGSCPRCEHVLPGVWPGDPQSVRTGNDRDAYVKRLPRTVRPEPSATPAAAARPLPVVELPATRSASGERKAMTSAVESTEAPRPTQPPRRELTGEEKDRLVGATAAFLHTLAAGQPAELSGGDLAGLGDRPVAGAFVSLKRRKHLRSCCGLLGRTVPLRQAVQEAATRTLWHDARFPPVSPTELEHLDMEIWLLYPAEPVPVRGEARAEAITLGKHGIQVVRGQQQALFLPSVATENDWDGRRFLDQVCVKAGLPPTAWREDDTQLFRFEGEVARGRLARSEGSSAPARPECCCRAEEIEKYAAFCRDNIRALLEGATPNYYCYGAPDGTVTGVVLTVGAGEIQIPGQSDAAHFCELSLRPGVPLQSTLFALCQNAARTLASRGVTAEALDGLAVDVAILHDPTLHGTVAAPDLAGFDPEHRALLVVERNKTSIVHDLARAPSELLDDAATQARVTRPAGAALYSLEVLGKGPLTVSTAPQPVRGAPVRPPAVAGQFYPARAEELSQLVDDLLRGEGAREAWPAAMVPHAGLRYSGRIAADVLKRLQLPKSIIVLGPKHTPYGVDWAVAPHETWSFPGGQVPSDRALAGRLCQAIDGLEMDALAHQREHAIEVELPFLARLAPQSHVVGIAIGAGDLESCRRFAAGLADVLRGEEETPLLLISSDMNHFATDAENRRLDALALEALRRLDPALVHDVVTSNNISMCGVLPAVIVLETLRLLGGLHRAESVGYATSADVTGDTSRVVGYAGMLFG